MLHDKHKDLESEKRRKLLEKLLGDVSKDAPDLYYRSTSEISQILLQHIDQTARLHPEERDLLKGLDARDIAMILSLH